MVGQFTKSPGPAAYLRATFHLEPVRDGPAAHHPSESTGDSDGIGRVGLRLRSRASEREIPPAARSNRPTARSLAASVPVNARFRLMATANTSSLAMIVSTVDTSLSDAPLRAPLPTSKPAAVMEFTKLSPLAGE